MRVYCAGKFEETVAVRAAQKALRDLGHEISHDWTGESAEGMPEPQKAAYLAQCAQKDYDGVMTADAILVINHPNGCGMFAELGMALAFGKLVYVSQTSLRDCIFFRMPGNKLFEKTEDAIAALDADSKA